MRLETGSSHGGKSNITMHSTVSIFKKYINMVINSLRSNGWLHSPFQSCGSRPTSLLNILWRSTSFVPNATAADVGHEIRITKPDDWHLHVREGKGLESVVPISAEQYSRAIIMPNLVPPVTTTDMVRNAT